MSDEVKFAKNAGVTVLRSAIGDAAKIVLFAVAATILPTLEEIGVYSTLVMISTMMYLLAAFAIPRASVRFIARYLGQSQPNNASSVARTIYRFGLIAAVLSSSLLFLFADVISQWLFGTTTNGYLFELLAPFVFLLIIQRFATSVLSGLQEFNTIAVIQTIQNILLVATGIYLLVIGWGLIGIITCWTIGHLVGNLLTIYALRGALVPSDTNHPFVPLLRFSAPIYGMDLLTYLTQNIDRFLVLFLAGTALLGIYTPAASVASILAVVGSSLYIVLIPKLSEIDGRSGNEGLKLAAKSASKWVFVICIPLSVGLASIGTPVMAIFGEKFTESVTPLMVISFGLAITCGQAVVSGVLLSLGRTKVFLTAAVIGWLSSFTLTILLLDPLGGTGAAIGRVGLQVSTYVITYSYMTFKAKISLNNRAFWSALFSSLAMFAVVLLFQEIIQSVFLIPLYALLGAFVYILVLGVTKIMNSQDMQLLEELVPLRISPLMKLVRSLLRIK